MNNGSSHVEEKEPESDRRIAKILARTRHELGVRDSLMFLVTVGSAFFVVASKWLKLLEEPQDNLPDGD